MILKSISYIKVIFTLSFVLFFANVQAQNEIITNSKIALKAGSSRELAKYFNDIVVLNFDGEESSYSKTQAEFVLRDFFKKYPATEFQYIHQGSSKEGLMYMIGKYDYNGGSYRVLIYIKQFKGSYFIDTLGFSKE
jgi:hypothetical protein